MWANPPNCFDTLSYGVLGRGLKGHGTSLSFWEDNQGFGYVRQETGTYSFRTHLSALAGSALLSVAS